MGVAQSKAAKAMGRLRQNAAIWVLGIEDADKIGGNGIGKEGLRQNRK